MNTNSYKEHCFVLHKDMISYCPVSADLVCMECNMKSHEGHRDIALIEVDDIRNTSQHTNEIHQTLTKYLSTLQSISQLATSMHKTVSNIQQKYATVCTSFTTKNLSTLVLQKSRRQAIEVFNNFFQIPQSLPPGLDECVNKIDHIYAMLLDANETFSKFELLVPLPSPRIEVRQCATAVSPYLSSTNKTKYCTLCHKQPCTIDRELCTSCLVKMSSPMQTNFCISCKCRLAVKNLYCIECSSNISHKMPICLKCTKEPAIQGKSYCSKCYNLTNPKIAKCLNCKAYLQITSSGLCKSCDENEKKKKLEDEFKTKSVPSIIKQEVVKDPAQPMPKQIEHPCFNCSIKEAAPGEKLCTECSEAILKKKDVSISQEIKSTYLPNNSSHKGIEESKLPQEEPIKPASVRSSSYAPNKKEVANPKKMQIPKTVSWAMRSYYKNKPL